MSLTLHPLTGSNTYRLFFKSTPRRSRRHHGRAGALARDAAASHLRGNEMPGLQLLVQRLARKRLARDRNPPGDNKKISYHKLPISIRVRILP